MNNMNLEIFKYLKSNYPDYKVKYLNVKQITNELGEVCSYELKIDIVPINLTDDENITSIILNPYTGEIK